MLTKNEIIQKPVPVRLAEGASTAVIIRIVLLNLGEQIDRRCCLLVFPIFAPFEELVFLLGFQYVNSYEITLHDYCIWFLILSPF